MSLTKFKDLEDARRALWTDSDDPRLASRIEQLWELSTRLYRRRISKGVQRFRSIEEANREREARPTGRSSKPVR